MSIVNLRFDDELSELFTRLWKLDENACMPGNDFKLNVQNDVGKNLFVYFKENILCRPTYAAFCKLLENYQASTNLPEFESEKKEKEESEFLVKILETKVMKEAHKYLVGKGKSSNDVNKFKKQLYDIWFKLYQRNSSDKFKNSCGFEHIFVGELRGNEVIGLHNWISLYRQEKLGRLKYHGCNCYDRSHPDGQYPEVLTFSFTWNDALKDKGSLFIGTSPEFEIAMYTIAFLCKQRNKIYVKINDHPIELIVYDHGDGIGSAYPICLKY